MEVTLITNDGERKIIQIPETNNYPVVLISAGRAFKKHPQTDEYVECTFQHILLSEAWDFLRKDKT